MFQVKDGWDPLCQFLNLPVADQPFPGTNYCTGMDDTALQQLSNTPGETAGTVNQETRTASLGCFIAIRFAATASGFSVEIKCE